MERIYYSDTLIGMIYQKWTVWWYMRQEEVKYELEREEQDRWWEEYSQQQQEQEWIAFETREQELWDKWQEEYEQREKERRAEEDRYEHYMNGICSKCDRYRFECNCYY